jgi:hypothetical protein
MKTQTHWLAVIGTALVALALSLPAHAGRSCETKPPEANRIERGLTLAEKTQTALNASGAKVVMLARAGQDLSKYGLRYSHLGWAYKTANGHWLVAHKLNGCGTADAAIYRQGLGEFFLDDPYRYETAWVVPTMEVQDKLLALLQDKSRLTVMHSKPYSVVSYAWATKYQQSNQWALETLAVAMDGNIRSREQAQAWLKYKNYQPSVLKISALTRLGGRMTSANIAFDDHPNDKRFSDQIETITVDSMFNWMVGAKLGAAPVMLRL